MSHIRTRIDEARKALARGWALIPLEGKVPRLKNWQKMDPAPEARVVPWARDGNLGLRTGSVSGLFVIDEDSPKGGDVAALELPRTPTVITGGGGRHYYFRAPDPCPGNSVQALGTGIDTRGEKGQVVFVGSMHPTTKEIYRWAPGLSPDDVELAEVPARVLELLEKKDHEPPSEPTPGPNVRTFPDGASPWAKAALAGELDKVTAAREGTRNVTLNGAAFKVGQIVGGGALDRGTAESQLLAAARQCGLPESEAKKTISSGLAGGIQRPRQRPETSPPTGGGGASPRGVGTTAPAPEPAPPPLPALAQNEILIPGEHLDDQSEYHTVGHDTFVDTVLEQLPRGLLYRRDRIVGEIVGDAGKRVFRELPVNRLRMMIDQHIRLTDWRWSKKTPPQKYYVPCTRDLASVVLDGAAVDDRVRNLKLLLNYPVFAGDFELVAEGWNEDHGIYYDEPPELQGIEADVPLETCRARIEDLVVDFPFKTDDDKHNLFGLLLTPLLRPALDGNTPLHMILSSLERTGKSKLAEQVVGGVILGHPTPAMQLSGSDEERDKRILSLLLEGQTLAHLDNLREYVDSAALASLLTSRTYAGRLLGKTQMLRIPNNLTLVASGNNVRATGEVVKRTVPIRLQPTTAEPETRTDFKHPDLPGYVKSVRRDILSALISMVARWKAEDGELYHTMGGFEEWSRVVGGVLYYACLPGHLVNLRDWARAANPEGEDLKAFVEAWAEMLPGVYANAKELLNLAETNDLFLWAIKGRSEQAKLVAFSKRVLARYTDTPVDRWVIRVQASGRNRQYYLESSSA